MNQCFKLFVVAHAALLLVACGGSVIKDSAPDKSINVSKIPDVVPRVEPIVSAGNPSTYKVLGKTYHLVDSNKGFTQTGVASWYGTKFHGRKTSNGETYDMYAITAAHKTLRIPTYVKVDNLDNGRSLIVRVNDRGPFHDNRVIDLSYAAAAKLGYSGKGTANVRVTAIDVERYLAKEKNIVNGIALVPDETRSTSVDNTLASQSMPPTVPVSEREAAAPIVVLAAETADDMNSSVVTTSRMESDMSTSVMQSASSQNVDLQQVYLQVGAFSQLVSAQQLQSELQQLVEAPVAINSQKQDALHRVRIGPIASTQEVEKLRIMVEGADLGSAQVVSE